eukprot:TRINITY_DN1538_c0_g3_i2.p1 TRINITY_DN1538_c0_g3~~TRINITY_DN1538_c0_g3_i2.p1  ORF type:complete len:209 (+),score=52.25 TRINITY_DN1538_c0_g3_i2:469-1095(+)
MRARKEQEALRFTPEINKKSKELAGKSHTPIYSSRRLQQLSFAKELKLARLKLNTPTTEHIPALSSQKLKKDRLCFDPDAVKSLFCQRNVTMRYYETTEDKEIKANCTFCPRISKKSKAIADSRSRMKAKEQTNSEVKDSKEEKNASSVSHMDCAPTEDTNSQVKLAEDESMKTVGESGYTVGELKLMLKSKNKQSKPGVNSVLSNYI